ncbi:MAG: 3-dehydroquinate synthase [Clostridia bacterium]|nr:3-dehydroquinate synthase [Clostridia bacterium]
MKKIRVKLKKNSYDIVFAKGGLSRVGKRIRPLVKGKNAMIVTDDNVARLYLDTLRRSLEKQGFNVFEKVVASGEQSKTAETYLEIIDALGRAEFLRDDTVVALGGGVVGDMAGFAAATYMRGINLVQVPTSLLAMIDSSIGGKVGVDLIYGKNLLGAFYQPKLVFVDVATLKTLPEREWQNGLGEGLKYAILEGGRLFDIVNGETVNEDLEEFVSLCAAYKAKIVEQDEREAGPRRLLNLGHTLGHAIEKKSGFEIPHGEAVKYGLKLVLQASKRLEGADADDLNRALDMLAKYGADCPYGANELLSLARNDKKAEDEGINAVFVKKIGECFVKKTDFEEFNRLFD